MGFKKVLFVCSGNVCRSPMAQTIFEDMVEKDPELRSNGIYAKSAGTLDLGRQRVSNEVIEVMQAEMSLDYETIENLEYFSSSILVDRSTIFCLLGAESDDQKANCRAEHNKNMQNLEEGISVISNAVVPELFERK